MTELRDALAAAAAAALATDDEARSAAPLALSEACLLALAAPCATPAAPAADIPAGAASAASAAVPASAWVAHHVLPQLAAAWAVAAARRAGASGVALRMVAVALPLLAAACAVLPAQAQVR